MQSQTQTVFAGATAAVGRAEERPTRRLRLRIEALEQRIAPNVLVDDDPVWPTLQDPPPDDPSFTVP